MKDKINNWALKDLVEPDKSLHINKLVRTLPV